MPQDAFTIFHTAKELNTILYNARVDKINQPNNDSIELLVRANNQNYWLTISSNAESARVTLSNNKSDSPLQAPSFCMLLRKHLSHANITNIFAIDYERIIVIDFTCKNEMFETCQKRLYCEIMGKYSNITLTENDIILGGIKQSISAEGLRPILPGFKYILPLPQDKVELSNKEQSLNVLQEFSGGDFAKFVFNRFKGLSIKTCIEIVYQFFNKTDLLQNEITCKIIDFYNYFKNYYENANIQPNCILFGDQKDFFITNYKSVIDKKQTFDYIYQAIEYYYAKRLELRDFDSTKRKITDILKSYESKLNKKIAIINDKLAQSNNLDDDLLYGQLLICNLYKINKGDSEVVVNDYTNDNKEITIKLDINLYPKQNAERYFKKYDKKKKTIIAVNKQKEEIFEELDNLNSIYDEIEIIDNIKDFEDVYEELKVLNLINDRPQKKNKQQEKPKYRCYQKSGFNIFVGKNNIQNDKLTMSADKNDLWLHTKDYHSSHVIIKSEGRKIPDDVLLYAGEICAYYSKAKNSQKVSVDYTLKKFVKKPSGTKLGKVFYSNYSTIVVTPNSHT